MIWWKKISNILHLKLKSLLNSGCYTFYIVLRTSNHYTFVEGGGGAEAAAGQHLLQLPGGSHDRRLSRAQGPEEDCQEQKRVPGQDSWLQRGTVSPWHYCSWRVFWVPVYFYISLNSFIILRKLRMHWSLGQNGTMCYQKVSKQELLKVR